MTTRRIRFQAIGTHWTIEVASGLRDRAWEGIMRQLYNRIEVFDKNYSRFRADSLVTQMSQRAGEYRLPEDGFALLDWYHWLYVATDGLVTPLIGQAIADAGYDAAYSLQSREMTPPPAWDDVLSYDEQKVVLARPALLDFGAAGKGYLVDLLGEMLEAAGIANYVINAGGDIRRRTTSGSTLTIGLENPMDLSQAVGTVGLGNASLCASSGARRKWGTYTHILSPATLESPADSLATWVMADSTMVADGLATALFFVKPNRLRDEFDFAYAMLGGDMRMTQSRNFAAKLFGGVPESEGNEA